MSLTLPELITTIGEDPVQVRTALELIKKNLTDLTALSQEEVDQALDSVLVRDASTGADKTITVEKLQAALARFGDLFNDFVVSGGLPTTSVDLETDTPATEAYISGLFVSLPEDTARAYTASVDTYVDAGIDGTFSYTEVPNGDPAPAVPADHIRLAVVVTDADNITGVTDLRVLGATIKDIAATNRPYVAADLTELQAINTAGLTAGAKAEITTTVRQNHVYWDPSDLSTEVAADEVTTGEGDGGQFIAPASDKTGTSGAWRPVETRYIVAEWYGLTDSSSIADVDRILSILQSYAGRVIWGGGNYNYSTTISQSSGC